VIAVGLALLGCEADGNQPLPGSPAADAGADVVAPQEDTVSAPDVDADTATPDADADDLGEADADIGVDADVEGDAVSPPEDAASADDAVGDAEGPPSCAPPLAVEPAQAWVFPLDLVELTASGGGGGYRFELAAGPSGAILNAHTGSYIAGPGEGVLDRVVLTDASCLGEAEAVIHVVERLALAPVSAEVPPGGAVTFHLDGGTGQLAWEVELDASGASVDAEGRYQAGPGSGRDVVRVTDLLTEEVARAAIEVRAGATLQAVPAVAFVPLGHRIVPELVGGSGAYRVASPLPEDVPAGLALDEAGWWVHEAGVFELTFEDIHTAQTAALRVIGQPPLEQEVFRSGIGLHALTVVGPGDVDGDGHPDVLVGIAEASLTRFQSGGLYIFAGGPDGLLPEPARVIAGAGREANLGRGVVVADFDGDGLLDLAVGSHRASVPPQSADGTVAIYPGVPGGFFADEPSRVLDGPFSGDNFGYALAACDFDGDGWLDLAVGAWRARDRSLSPTTADQGGVHIFRGGPEGFAAEADQVLFGVEPDGSGGWRAAPAARLGSSLAVGDLDGDGICDLAAGGTTYGHIGSNDGIVLVFRGGSVTGAAPGGLDPIPVRAFAGDTAGGNRLGAYLAIGDVDRDGVGDLLVSQGYWNAGAGNDRRGAARLFAGGPAFASPVAAFESPSTADWWVSGERNSDHLGYNVAVADATGDGGDDVILTSWLGRCDGCPNQSGLVQVFAGRPGEWPELSPARVFAGSSPGARLGGGLGVVGDVDGDGEPELVLVAPFDVVDGLGLPQAYVTGRDDEAAFPPLLPLATPGEPGGWKVGHAVTFLADRDGDDLPELAVGAPHQAAGQAASPFRVQGGVVHLYRGAEGGLEVAPTQTLEGFPGHAASDWFGRAVADAGDFDGDGLADLAVVSRYNNRPTNYGAAFLPGPGCGSGARSNAGAVYVFAGDGAGAVEPSPAFVYHGHQAGRGLESVLGLDLDGDGLGDLVVGSRSFNGPAGSNVGGFEVVFGRARAVHDRIEAICEPGFIWLGHTANDQGGTALAALGDVDGDGCEDFAYGAWLEDLGITNRGAVRVVFGWGPGCAAAAPRAVTLVTGGVEDRSGFALASGDLDGDGRYELLVGGPNHRREGVTVGGVWLVDGRHLAAVAALAEPLTSGAAPTAIAPLVPASDLPGLSLAGLTPGEGFGTAVAVIPSLGPGGTPAIAVASPGAVVAGADGVGIVRIHRVELDGAGRVIRLEPEPVAVLGAETEHPGAMAAVALAAGAQGAAGLLAIGAIESAALALDTGAVYVAPLGLVEIAP